MVRVVSEGMPLATWGIMAMRRNAVLLLSATLLASGCTGLIGDGSSETDEEAIGDQQSELCANAATNAGRAPLRRLTRLEYDNSVRALLGLTGELPVELPADSETAGFAANNNNFAGERELEAYMDSAVALAELAATTGLAALPELKLDCDTTTEACMRGFVEQFGRRAFRRALTPDETERYVGLFVSAQNAWTDGEAHRLVMRAFLQSPNFLYLPERGSLPDRGGASDEADGVVKLSGYELASRLSFFLWKSMPDERLLLAAEAGTLTDSDSFEEEVRRMLADERAKSTIASFHGQWLHIADLDRQEKDATLFPGWTPELGAAMRDETLQVAIATIWDPAGDAKLSTLFTTTRSFASDELAAFYGVTPDSDGAIEHDPAQRAGILTHASVMAALAHSNSTSWVFRGRFVREDVLCDVVPPPPANVDMTVLNDSNRLVDDACKTCHLLMDPIGAGFENFDAIGNYRDVYPELPEGPLTPFRVEGSGANLDVDGTFETPVELAERIAQSRSAADCMAEKWFTFATMRAPEDEDNCAVRALQEQFAEANFDVRELIVNIALADNFTVRRTEATEAE